MVDSPNSHLKMGNFIILGKLMYVINDAHLHGVTALAVTSDSNRVVSGGSEGEVRVFKLGNQINLGK